MKTKIVHPMRYGIEIIEGHIKITFYKKENFHRNLFNLIKTKYECLLYEDVNFHKMEYMTSNVTFLFRKGLILLLGLPTYNFCPYFS